MVSILRLEGAAGNMTPDLRRQAEKVLGDPKPLVHQNVLIEDINGRHGYPPEWAGNVYAKSLLELVRDQRGLVEVSFDGWDADPRPIFQIPEVQKWCAGFLGRVVVVRLPSIEKIAFRRHPRGAWEGRVLAVLKREDMLFPGKNHAGTQVRVFGSAEQLSARPRVVWTLDPASGLWLMDPQEAHRAIETAIAETDLLMPTEVTHGHGKTLWN
jgi:hypothetical protein